MIPAVILHRPPEMSLNLGSFYEKIIPCRTSHCIKSYIIVITLPYETMCKFHNCSLADNFRKKICPTYWMDIIELFTFQGILGKT